MIAYGSIGLILALYLHEVGLSDKELGAVLALSLLGDAALSLVVTLFADRVGRKKMLLLGCAFKMLAAVLFCLMRGASIVFIAFAACIGVVSPSGNEVGPFMALEQSIMSELLSPSVRTTAFAWYNVVGYLSSAVGSAEAGILVDSLQNIAKWPLLTSYRAIFAQYGLLVVPVAAIFLFLSREIESPVEDAQSDGHLARKATVGLSARASKIVAPLSALFALDSFAGSLVTGEFVSVLNFNAHSHGIQDDLKGRSGRIAHIKVSPEEAVPELIDSVVSQVHCWLITSSSGLQFRHRFWEACYSQQMSYLGRHLCHPGETGPQL